jgi:DNA-binding winged helix-turn-helix (wHTH) protein
VRYRIAEFEIDARRRELRRGGSLIRTEPKVLDAILHLVANRDRVVTKAELLDLLWPSEDVMEGALTVCIHRARRALTDGTGTRSSLIETVPRRGYRLAADVVELPAHPPASPRRSRRRRPASWGVPKSSRRSRPLCARRPSRSCAAWS